MKAHSENWSTWILGSKWKEEHSGHMVAVTYLSFSQTLHFLCKRKNLNKGIFITAKHSPDNHELVHRSGRKSQLVDLKDIVSQGRVYPFDVVFDSDYCFVVYNGDDYPRTTEIQKLYMWAREKKLPYVYGHNNDHAWFVNFTSTVKRELFLYFISLSIFRLDLRNCRMPNEKWEDIRQGLYEHGWTLNRMLCASIKGQYEYLLWGGVPSASLVRSQDNQRPSMIKRRLKVVVSNKRDISNSFSQGRCPLGDTYGKLLPFDTVHKL